MKAVAAAFFAGLSFAAGLAISGMTQPAKVIGFLDFTGNWDASLALVMVGAIGVYLPLNRLIYRRSAPTLEDQFHSPRFQQVDTRLVGGAALFGIGWGASGYCPGPGLMSIAGGTSQAVVFVAAMGTSSTSRTTEN